MIPAITGTIDADEINVFDPEPETVVTSLLNYLNNENRLGEHIDENAFYDEWADANGSDYEDSLCVHTVGDGEHEHVQPALRARTAIINDSLNTANTYSIGKYKFKLQVDIWTASKYKRNQLYKSLYSAINEAFINGSDRSSGLSLMLENYFSAIARYDITSYNFPDSESVSQEDEWRVRIQIDCHFDQRVMKIEPIMADIQTVTSDQTTGEEYISPTVNIGE